MVRPFIRQETVPQPRYCRPTPPRFRAEVARNTLPDRSAVAGSALQGATRGRAGLQFRSWRTERARLGGADSETRPSGASRKRERRSREQRESLCRLYPNEVRISDRATASELRAFLSRWWRRCPPFLASELRAFLSRWWRCCPPFLASESRAFLSRWWRCCPPFLASELRAFLSRWFRCCLRFLASESKAFRRQRFQQQRRGPKEVLRRDQRSASRSNSNATTGNSRSCSTSTSG